MIPYDQTNLGYPIDRQWYDQAFFWDRMDPAYPGVSMKEALDYLREHHGTVFFLSETKSYFPAEKTIDFIAKADAHQLADRIEFEWYESYRLASRDMYIPDALPNDLYVFCSTMMWCGLVKKSAVGKHLKYCAEFMRRVLTASDGRPPAASRPDRSYKPGVG